MLRKLRVGVVVGAALLVAVVAGFVWYGRLKAFNFKLALPKKLGLNITQESHVVTLSRSVAGKPVFTMHAADQVQQTNGMIELHDVGIELFGRQDGRSDKISGQDFLFDQKAGVMTGVGAVFIDLAAPPSKSAKSGAVAGEEKTVHVKTSGLIFSQSQQTAVTDQGIEFAASGMTGTAVGAAYDAKSGTVELKSKVHVSGLQNGRPVVLTAAWAELQRSLNVVLLTGAKYTGLGSRGGQTVAADHATVHITPDGTPQEIDGQGHVVLTGADRGTMTGEQMQLTLTESGKPRAGRLWGGVAYAYAGERKKAAGTAREVRVAFDAAGNAQHATADGGVTFNEQLAGEGLGGVERRLTAAKVELGFGGAAKGAGKGKVHLEDADATGGAALHTSGVTARGRTATDLAGDELKAKFVEAGGRDAVKTLDGAGHTVVHQVAADGTEETSRGAMLAAIFLPGGTGNGKPGKGGNAASQIERAVQRGGVTMVRITPAKSGPKPVAAQVEHAAADEAVYEADAQRLTLTGAVQVQDSTSTLLAETVVLLRESGDVTAEGNVRVSSVQDEGKGEPVHITAARAVERKAAGTADFYGSGSGGAGGKDARMWQGGSQVQAPVLSFMQDGNDKTTRRMVAHGEMAGDADFVRAVLVGSDSKVTGGGTQGGGAGTGRGGPIHRDGTAMNGAQGGGAVRIVGHEMNYVERARTVEFKGRVKVQDQSGVMTAQRAIATLSEKKPSEVETGAQGAGAGLMGSRVERVVAKGAVEVEQPGRKGMGEQLVYTEADQLFVLTGTPAVPPKVVDEARGTTTGAVLTFRSGDDSVVITGGTNGDGAGRKVQSETRMRQKP